MLLVIIFGAVVAASLSAMVGAMCATEAAIGPAPIIMAAMALNGGLVPVEQFAGVVQPIARWNPLTFAAAPHAAIDGTPSAEILATGQPGTAVWAFVAWMVALTVVLLAAAAAFRRPTMS